MNLERLEKSALVDLATRWDAPSTQPAALARYLSAPLQIQRRIEALSHQGRDELTALLEATTDHVPVEVLRQAAVEELADMLLIEISGEEPLEVHLSREVALAALEVLPSTPCRLRLLLHALDRDALTALHHRVNGSSAQMELLSLELPRRICAVLSSPEDIAELLRTLPQASTRALWSMVERGGLVAPEQADADADLAPLMEAGIVWRTALDARVPVEILRALLMLRLGRRAHRAAARLSAQREADADNVLSFPGSASRWLAHAVSVMTGLKEGTKIGAIAQSQLLDAEPGPVADARLALAKVAGLFESRGKGIVATPSASRRWTTPTPGGLGAALSEQVAERVVWGEPWSGVDDAARALLGPDVQSGELPDSEEATGEALCAVAPHLLDPEEAAVLSTGAQLGALRLLRALLQRILASLRVGQHTSVGDLDAVVEAMGDVARSHQRLLGCPYARDPRAPAPETRRGAIESWLAALALPLGWLEPTDPQPEIETAPQAGLLPLFAQLAPTAEPAVHRAIGPLRVAAQAPSVSPEIAGLATLPEPHLAALAPIWTDGGTHTDEEEDDTERHALSDQIGAFVQSANSADGGVAEGFRGFLLGQTAARRLQDVRTEDLTRFLVAWSRIDLPAGSISELRKIFSGLAALSSWSKARRAPLGADLDALREELEGRLLRTCSAEAAFRVRLPPRPPADLLQRAPSTATDGLHTIISLSPSRGMMTVEALSEPDVHRTVRTVPEPLGLLSEGDLIDAQLIQYGDVCWLARLRRVLLAEAARFL